MYNQNGNNFSQSKLVLGVRDALYNPNGNNLSNSQLSFAIYIASKIIEDFNNGVNKKNLIFAPPQSGKTGVFLEVNRIIVNSYLDGKIIMDEEFRRDSSDIISYMILHTSDNLLKNQQENRIDNVRMNSGKYRLNIVQRDDWKNINIDTDDNKLVIICGDESHEGNVEYGQVFKSYNKLGYDYCSKPNSKTIVMITSASPCGHLLDAINNPDDYNIFIPPLELNYLSPQLLFKMNRVHTLDKNIFSYKKNSHTIDINYNVINEILETNYSGCIQNKKSTGEIVLNSNKIKDNKYIIVRISSSLLPNDKESLLIRSLSKMYKFSGIEKEKQVFDVKYINSYHGNIDELIEILDHKPAKLTFLIIRNALKRGATPNTGYIAAFIDLTKDGASTIQGGFGRMLGYVSQKESQTYSRKDDKFSVYLYTKSYKNLYKFYTSLENIYNFLKENDTYILPPDMYKLLTYIPSSIDNKECDVILLHRDYTYNVEILDKIEFNKKFIKIDGRKRIKTSGSLAKTNTVIHNLFNNFVTQYQSGILKFVDDNNRVYKFEGGTRGPRNGINYPYEIIDGLHKNVSSDNRIMYNEIIKHLNNFKIQFDDKKEICVVTYSENNHNIVNNNSAFKKNRIFN